MTSLYDCGQTLTGRVFSEPAKPSPAHDNDLWFNTLTSAWSLYSGGKWNPLTAAGGAGITFPPPVNAGLPIAAGVTHPAGAIVVHPGPDGAKVDPSYTGVGGQTINTGDWLVFDGTKWHLLHAAANALTKITYAVQALPTDPAGIGSAWTALAVKPTDAIILATFNSGTYLKTGTGGADADWLLVETPPPGNLGTVDTTAAYTAPATAPKPGAIATVQTAGAAHASWGAVGVTGALAAGDLLVWDGTQYHVVPQTYPYLPLAGGTHTDTAVVTYDVPAGAAPAAPVVRLDGGDNAKSAIDNWRIGGGVF